MIVDTQRMFLILLVITGSLKSEGRSEASRRSKGVNKLEHLPQINKAENETDQKHMEFPIGQAVLEGIEMAVKECKNQFKWDRWNCPGESFDLLSNTLESKATKETAYIQAITAAGIMYQVIKKCKHPDIDICGCDSEAYKELQAVGNRVTGSESWKWKGCIQNDMFGKKVAQLFLGTEIEANSTRRAMKAHNVHVGLVAVTSSLRKQCTCYYPPAFCSVLTCWKVVPELTVIASQLKQKYKKAKAINYQNGTLHATKKGRNGLIKKISEDDLVYYETSPDYCKPDNTTGYEGTSGRECKMVEKGEKKPDMSKWERSSCRRLCNTCGYNVKMYSVNETFNDCECAFFWCCQVKCKTCHRQVEYHYCE